LIKRLNARGGRCCRSPVPSAPGDRKQPCPSRAPRECGLLLARAPVTQATAGRAASASDRRRDALLRGRKEPRSHSGQPPRADWSPAALAVAPSRLSQDLEAPQDPSPLILGRKPGLRSPHPLCFAAAWRSRRPRERLLASASAEKEGQERLAHTCWSRVPRGLHAGSARTRSKPAAQQLHLGGGRLGALVL
jgi:hypothetical protein